MQTKKRAATFVTTLHLKLTFKYFSSQRYLLIFAEVIEPLQVMKLYRVDEKVSREAHKIMKYRQQAAEMDAKK